MNNVKTSDMLERAWLKVDKVGAQDGFVIARASLFDGTTFELALPETEYEDQGPDVPGLVKVGYVGDTAGVSEVVLPRPALKFGYTVRVKPSSLVHWALYNKKKAT